MTTETSERTVTLHRLDQRVGTGETALKGLNVFVRHRVADMDARFDAMDARVAEVMTELRALRGQVASLANRRSSAAPRTSVR